MKRQFPEYYRVTRNELHERFEELIFVFDASALLDIFRLDKTISNEIFEVLERYSSQIAIPYHVAEEYNKKIHSVLQEQLHHIDDAQKAFDVFTNLLEEKRNQPYISSKSAQKLKSLKNSIQNDFQVQRQFLLDQLLHGEFQNKMSDMLDGKVMDPFSAEELQKIQEEGEKRYENKIPPGWKDNTKGENAYGDLINWKEILRYAKVQQKNIIFVTNDQKEDWICKFEGKVVCPHYELLREFYQVVENKHLIFHIYTLDRFLDFVHAQDKDSVSEGAIEQVRDLLTENSLYSLMNPMSGMHETFAKIEELSGKYRDLSKMFAMLYPSRTLSKEEGRKAENVDDAKENLTETKDDSQSYDKEEGRSDLEDASTLSSESQNDEPDES